MKELMPLNTDHQLTGHASLLRELTKVKIDTDQPVPLRVQRFIADVCDPYHFTVNGTAMQISFIGSGGINTRLAGALSAVNEQGTAGVLIHFSDTVA